MKKIDYIRTAIAKYHMSRYCKLMSKVVNKKFTPEDIYERIIKTRL